MGRTLLRDGFIVDGTEGKGYGGSLIINGDKIEEIIEGSFAGTEEAFSEVIDCRGYLITPGFIDIHSHLDWYLPHRGKEEYKLPFTKQGITTIVGGNCGYSASGIKRDTKHMESIEDNLFKGARGNMTWNNFEEYFKSCENSGLSHNAVMLAGHGTTRTSVCGKSHGVSEGELEEILKILDYSLDEGTAGISFGLQYVPGQYASVDEITRAAKLAARKNKILTAHARAYSKLSGDYPLVPFGEAHNIKAIRELIGIAERTGVRLQLSHLIFAGKSTHKTCEEALNLIDKAIERGVEVSFDTYGHHCGVSVITVFLPPWFKARGSEAWTNTYLLGKVRLMMSAVFKLLGFDYSSIQILDANCAELECYNGMYLSDIAEKRGISNFENYMDFIKKSKGTACVLMHNYTSEDNLYELIKHKASMFMTDSWLEPSNWQNPGVYGSLPRILQLVREKNLLTIEEAIYKMTGAPAEKVGIVDRGAIRKGLAADIVMLDWDKVKFSVTSACRGESPRGIEHVFINGGHVVCNGEVSGYKTFGKALRV